MGLTQSAAPFRDPSVAAAFDSFPEPLRDRLTWLRTLVFETASATAGVGEIEETLKWGQPSYVASRPASGTPIRIGPFKADPDRYALFVHCQTSLIESIRQRYGDALRYDGNRAVVFHIDEDPPREILAHCISLALTYHRDRSHRRDKSIGR